MPGDAIPSVIVKHDDAAPSQEFPSDGGVDHHVARRVAAVDVCHVESLAARSRAKSREHLRRPSFHLSHFPGDAADVDFGECGVEWRDAGDATHVIVEPRLDGGRGVFLAVETQAHVSVLLAAVPRVDAREGGFRMAAEIGEEPDGPAPLPTAHLEDAPGTGLVRVRQAEGPEQPVKRTLGVAEPVHGELEGRGGARALAKMGVARVEVVGRPSSAGPSHREGDRIPARRARDVRHASGTETRAGRRPREATRASRARRVNLDRRPDADDPTRAARSLFC